jgi:hypothetical protein
MQTYRISSEYSKFPGSRYINECMWSGEDFRKNHLSKIVKECLDNNQTLLIDLDGTAGYSTGFLEEAFGGLIRENIFRLSDLLTTLRFKSDEEPYLIKEIIIYMTEAKIESMNKLAMEE